MRLELTGVIAAAKAWQLSWGGCCQLDESRCTCGAGALTGPVVPVEVFFLRADDGGFIQPHPQLDSRKLPGLETHEVVLVTYAQPRVLGAPVREVWVVPQVVLDRNREDALKYGGHFAPAS